MIWVYLIFGVLGFIVAIALIASVFGVHVEWNATHKGSVTVGKKRFDWGKDEMP